MGDVRFVYHTGDQVTQKALGSPYMTIDTCGVDSAGEVYVCGWWTKEGKYETRWFRVKELVPVS